MFYYKLQVLLNKLNADMFAKGNNFDNITVKKDDFQNHMLKAAWSLKLRHAKLLR